MSEQWPEWLMSSEIPLGWHQLALGLDTGIRALVPGYTLDQGKEKHGRLCFYISLPDGVDVETEEQVEALISEAAEKSRFISLQ